MIVLRPTLKLAGKLKLDPLSDAPKPTNAYCDWCIRSFSVGRVQYLLFTNTPSLFSFVTRKKGIANARTLVDAFETVLGHYLWATGRGQIFDRLIAPAAAQYAFARCRDRSIVGSINDLAYQAKYQIEPADRHPFELFEDLNSAPMGVLGMDRPRNVFASLLAELPED